MWSPDEVAGSSSAEAESAKALKEETAESSSPAADEPQVDAALLKDSRSILVQCGSLTASLILKRFICPGIHEKCIELDDDIITPKEFTIRANKDKQKDWKGSIRIGKSTLRSLMELGSIKFYNHRELCNAKCHSRNYITPKSPSEKERARKDSKAAAAAAAAAVANNALASLAGEDLSRPDNSMVFANMLKAVPAQLAAAAALKKTESSELNNNLIWGLPTTIPHVHRPSIFDAEATRNANPLECQIIKTLMLKQPVKFWSLLRELGQIEEVLTAMVVRLAESDTLSETVAFELSRLVATLDMASTVHTSLRNAQARTPLIETRNDDKERNRLEKRKRLDAWVERARRFNCGSGSPIKTEEEEDEEVNVVDDDAQTTKRARLDAALRSAS